VGVFIRAVGLHCAVKPYGYDCTVF
jgi:hypothetical protein